MKLLTILVPLVLTGLLASAPAHAWPKRGTTGAAGSCPFGNAYSDGCTSAPPGTGTTNGTLYQNTAFFTYAKQSSQGSYFSAPGVTATHPPPWNIAGVDYAVGIPSTVSLVSASAAPTGSGPGKLPTGCTYSTTGSAQGGPIVICTSMSSPTIDGIDFTNNGTACVPLQFNASVTGNAVVKNSKFVFDYTGLYATVNCNVPNNYLVRAVNPSGLTSITFTNDYFNGNAPGSILPQTGGFNNTGSFINIAGTTVAMVIEYSVFLNIDSRPISSSAWGAVTLAFNYFENFVYSYRLAFTPHAEVLAPGFGTTGHTQPSTQYSFNTVLQGTSISYGTGTAPIYPSDGVWGNGSTLANVQVDHNTTINNYAGGFTGTTFTGTITGTDLAVTAGTTPAVGQHLVKTGLTTNTVILSNDGGGHFTVNNSQTVGSGTFTVDGNNTSAAIADTSNNHYTVVTYTANYTDPTGAPQCFKQDTSVFAGGQPTWTGNVNMLNGNAITANGACP